MTKDRYTHTSKIISQVLSAFLAAIASSPLHAPYWHTHRPRLARDALAALTTITPTPSGPHHTVGGHARTHSGASGSGLSAAFLRAALGVALSTTAAAAPATATAESLAGGGRTHGALLVLTALLPLPVPGQEQEEGAVPIQLLATTTSSSGLLPAAALPRLCERVLALLLPRPSPSSSAVVGDENESRSHSLVRCAAFLLLPRLAATDAAAFW